jgi:hypothetical protein
LAFELVGANVDQVDCFNPDQPEVVDEVLASLDRWSDRQREITRMWEELEAQRETRQREFDEWFERGRRGAWTDEDREWEERAQESVRLAPERQTAFEEMQRDLQQKRDDVQPRVERTRRMNQGRATEEDMTGEAAQAVSLPHDVADSASDA